jgi:hypothetical protein
MFPQLGFARLIAEAILLSLLGIFLLIIFITVRRWYRGRYFWRLNERTFALRSRGMASSPVQCRPARGG